MKLFNAKLALAILAMASGFVASSSTHDGHPRRELFPSNSIAQEMSNEHAKGNSNPRFTLTAGLVAASNNSNLFGGTTQGSSSSFSVNVREPVQAVTKDTTYSEYDGRHELVGELDHTILVADMDAEEDGTVALISVNKVTEEVNGIVHKGGRKMKFTQKKGKKANAYAAPEFVPPAWECGVGHDHESAGRRSLEETSDEQSMKDHHHHEDSSHNDHREHHHNHDMSDIDSALSYIKDNLRGSSVRLGKRRKLQSGGSYSYQVDIYLEIDQQLVNDNGGILNPNTINYVNSIFTGANSIYESEIDTHLSLLHIALTSNYNSASGTGNALDTMRSIYASQGFGYYPGIDLHHALLSNNLGGGIAYLGVLCDSNYGFGLSASLSGNFVSMSNSVVWDMMVFMHEVRATDVPHHWSTTCYSYFFYRTSSNSSIHLVPTTDRPQLLFRPHA